MTSADACGGDRQSARVKFDLDPGFRPAPLASQTSRRLVAWRTARAIAGSTVGKTAVILFPKEPHRAGTADRVWSDR
jgi:hypothetical protein